MELKRLTLVKEKEEKARIAAVKEQNKLDQLAKQQAKAARKEQAKLDQVAKQQAKARQQCPGGGIGIKLHAAHAKP